MAGGELKRRIKKLLGTAKRLMKKKTSYLEPVPRSPFQRNVPMILT
ncbi:MAG: hypothetical protein PWQ46_318 [Methanomicrobiaceae archaeon]|nr:hypothetical protein [Methanomicrobiaceae archaeon]